jgi:predicted dehydrogenase
MPLISRHASEIRVAVTGLGKMGAFHVKALGQLANGESEAYYKSGLRQQVVKVRPCAFCDLEPARAQALGEAPVFQDHLELLEATHPDIAIIATPSHSHYPLAMATLNAGVHTFVEKPATLQVTQWEALVALANRNQLRLMAGHVERYNPVAIKIHSLLKAGGLNVTGYTFTRSQPPDLRIPDDIVSDKLVHDLDLAMFFFGPVASHSVINCKHIAGQTRELTLRLTHRNGLQGELFVSWLQTGPGRIRECRCRTAESGDLRGDFVAKQLMINATPVECAVPNWVKPDNNQIKDELADFVGYCLEPDPALPPIQPLLSPAEVGSAIAIIEQVSLETSRLPSRGKGYP